MLILHHYSLRLTLRGSALLGLTLNCHLNISGCLLGSEWRDKPGGKRGSTLFPIRSVCCSEKILSEATLLVFQLQQMKSRREEKWLTACRCGRSLGRRETFKSSPESRWPLTTTLIMGAAALKYTDEGSQSWRFKSRTWVNEVRLENKENFICVWSMTAE